MEPFPLSKPQALTQAFNMHFTKFMFGEGICNRIEKGYQEDLQYRYLY